MYNTIIIGAGVSGLIAAGKIAQSGRDVVVFEKMERTARKLRITGKGRCNITNLTPIENHLEKLRSQNSDFIQPALQNFDSEAVVALFEQIGAPTTLERGARVYPKSQSAVDVAQRLTTWAEKQGAKIQCNSEVDSIIKIENGFSVSVSGKTYESKNIIVSTGGVSYPKTGSTGDGYGFAHNLGHNIIPVRPSLVALRINEQIPDIELKNTGIALFINNIEADKRFGDVDFTDRGLAGAATLQLSRLAVDAICNNNKVIAQIDLKPALSHLKIVNRINRELENLQSASFKVLLQKLTPSALHRKISAALNISLTSPLNRFRDVDIDTLATTLKGLSFSVTDYGGFGEAIVTAGGIDTLQVEAGSMQSKLHEGLYFCGEVLDIDSDTGGYNIQLAISTAVLAAKSILER